MRKVKTISNPMFEIKNVSKSYGGNIALSPLSLTVRKGETVALVGPSGSGKTTLLNILANMIKPDSGEVIIDGIPAGKLRPGREMSGKVGIIHQQLDLVDQLPVIHNVLAGRLGQWSLFRSLLSLIIPQDKELAVNALERVGLLEKIYSRTSHLSGGEQQRVALARILVQRPQAILADEPVSALDPARAEDLLQLLVGFAREEQQTLIASLHSVEYATRYFSRIIALREGKIYFDRPAVEVKDSDLAQLYELKEDANAKAVS
ncbi:phosphonate ABC transporter ATP-binding protein [Zhaonella formicivorans]|uniref:phosphonate ABC transporter ATP-binding protein n=1 Tax=Zhaonella formicivorans TaxID=2528593 RepID=UPI001D12C151|nr:phosphonate ABC transporter ATP-binding protein [Zhaonella formicivorans]